MNQMLNLQYHCIFCIMWRHIKAFTNCFHRKSVCPVIWRVTGKEKSTRFLETVILCEVFLGNFKRKLGSSFCYHTTSVHTCFCVGICFIFRFVCLTDCFCAMLFSVSHLSTVHSNIVCCLCYMPCVYLKCFMFTLRLLSFISQNSLDSSLSDLLFLWSKDFCDLHILV